MPDKVPRNGNLGLVLRVLSHVQRVVYFCLSGTVDVQQFRQAGIKYLDPSTPVMDGRSCGTNLMEAALFARAGKGRKLTCDELSALLGELGVKPQLEQLN